MYRIFDRRFFCYIIRKWKIGMLRGRKMSVSIAREIERSFFQGSTNIIIMKNFHILLWHYALRNTWCGCTACECQEFDPTRKKTWFNLSGSTCDAIIARGKVNIPCHRSFLIEFFIFSYFIIFKLTRSSCGTMSKGCTLYCTMSIPFFTNPLP